METREAMLIKGLGQQNTELTEMLAEAVFILEQARPLFPLVKVNCELHRSALSARCDALLDKIARDLGEEFDRYVKMCGA